MQKLVTLAIAATALNCSYGFSLAQTQTENPQNVSMVSQGELSDDDYLAIANSEAFEMFTGEFESLEPADQNKVYILGLGQVSSSFFCALDVMDKVSEIIDIDGNGLLFVEVSDILPYLHTNDCHETEIAVIIVDAALANP